MVKLLLNQFLNAYNFCIWFKYFHSQQIRLITNEKKPAKRYVKCNALTFTVTVKDDYNNAV